MTGVSKLDFGVKFATDPKSDYETANWQPVQGFLVFFLNVNKSNETNSGITTHALIEPSGTDVAGGIMETVSLLAGFLKILLFIKINILTSFA